MMLRVRVVAVSMVIIKQYASAQQGTEARALDSWAQSPCPVSWHDRTVQPLVTKENTVPYSTVQRQRDDGRPLYFIRQNGRLVGSGGCLHKLLLELFFARECGRLSSWKSIFAATDKFSRNSGGFPTVCWK
jgi:hypothetical protein